MKKITNIQLETRRLVGMAVFAAMSYAVTFVFRIPVQFLTFDAKDAVLTIAAFVYGPTSALIMSFIPAFVEFITISGTGFWGFLMNFVSSACFSFTASLIYKYRRNFSGAIIGLYVSVAATTAFMALMNMLITPIYMKVPTDTVMKLLPSLLLPFNFAKALMNSAIVMLLYKPISTAIKRVKLVRVTENAPTATRLGFNKSSLVMAAIALVTLGAAIAVFVIIA